MKIKINKLDKLFSELIRKRAKNHCEIGGEHKEFNQLQACHAFGRRKQSVRYDPRNALAGCMGHHRQMDENHEMKREIFMRRLGENQYKALMVEAETPRKIDKKIIDLQLRELLKEHD